MSSPRTLTVLLVVQRAVTWRPTYSTLANNLPGLNAAVGAQSFYENFRNAAVHEFSRSPALQSVVIPACQASMLSVQQVHGVPGKTLVLNIDLLAEEFLAHLDALLANLRRVRDP